MIRSAPRRLLVLLLCASAALRCGLAVRGGQNFWPDEARYADARSAAQDLLAEQWGAAGAELFGHPEHPGFRWIALPPALFEEIAGPHPAVPAAYFGLFGVAAIALLWGIARRLGAGEVEALWAVLFAAGADSLFFYSRHYFPYDPSLCLMLVALWVGLKPGGAERSMAAGALAAAGFLVYNGYWLLGGCVLVLHALFGPGGWRRLPVRALGAGAGLALVMAAFIGGAKAAGFDWLGQSRRFAGTITQGDFGQGWRVIAGYLWSAERGLLVLWLLAWGYALGTIRERAPLRRLAASAVGLGFLVGGLVFFSDAVPKFAVYGRLVRSAVPFLCLGAAVGAARWTGASVRRTGLLATAAIVLAAANFLTPWRQVFPNGFLALARREVDRSARSGLDAYRLENVGSLWGRTLTPPPTAGTVLRRPHPLQFRPYQYEGYSAAQRAAINRIDVAMRLVRLPDQAGSPGPDWEGYSGPVRFELTLPAGRTGAVEPLLSSGRAGAGDLVFLRYLDGSRVVFGLEHWGGGARYSEPVACDGSRPHEIILADGLLLPPAGAAAASRHPEWAAWRDRLAIWLDGRMVLFLPAGFYSARADSLALGINLMGGSLVDPGFTGKIAGLSALPMAQLMGLPQAQPAFRSPGEVRFQLRFPRDRAGRREPLVVTGVPGRGDLLSVGYVDSGHIRFALDHWARSFLESDAVPIDYGRLHDLDISLPVRSSGPGAADLITGPLAIRLDGALVWSRPVELYRTPPATRDFGANRIGGSTCDPVFTGGIVSVVQAEEAHP